MVGHLRHALTGRGVLDWFERPHPLVGDRPPQAFIDEPDALPTLTRLAASTRSACPPSRVPELSGFRVASWDTPLRVNPNRQPGRWNYADSGATQYIALHPLATWAEYMRWHDLRDRRAIAQIRLGVWAIRAIVDDLLIVGFDNADRVGLRPEDLISDDWSACQATAERLRSDRSAPKALETPSAALPGARNLVILDARVGIPYTQDPIDDVDTPVTLAAAGARPPASLLELVRFRGEPHAEYEAWRRGDRFALDEPSDSLLASDVRDTL